MEKSSKRAVDGAGAALWLKFAAIVVLASRQPVRVQTSNVAARQAAQVRQAETVPLAVYLS